MAAAPAESGVKAPLKVCILWHMHQPDYRDPVSDQTLLPWTWLHGLKDYGEMLETIAETGARVTVNLVPTLLEQLERLCELALLGIGVPQGQHHVHPVRLFTDHPLVALDGLPELVDRVAGHVGGQQAQAHVESDLSPVAVQLGRLP